MCQVLFPASYFLLQSDDFLFYVSYSVYTRNHSKYSKYKINFSLKGWQRYFLKLWYINGYNIIIFNEKICNNNSEIWFILMNKKYFSIHIFLVNIIVIFFYKVNFEKLFIFKNKILKIFKGHLNILLMRFQTWRSKT